MCTLTIFRFVLVEHLGKIDMRSPHANAVALTGAPVITARKQIPAFVVAAEPMWLVAFDESLSVLTKTNQLQHRLARRALRLVDGNFLGHQGLQRELQ